MENFNGKTPHCELEKELFLQVEANTPEYIKKDELFDIRNPEAFEFVLKKEHLEKYDAQLNPAGLGLGEWFENYEKEAKVSTAGIRGPQNILYPQDTRFPINKAGIMLATIGKALSALQKHPDGELHKILGGEVRYNTIEYLDIISRLQAQFGIKTHIPVDKAAIPIWMASFLAFKLDLLGGEYITSSHGISVKNATKDLNDQGSQYLPEESMEFVNKIKEIFNETEKNGQYVIKFSSADNPNIDEKLMKELDNGAALYVEYLKDSVATLNNLEEISTLKNKVIIENVGGSAYHTLSKILKELNIADNFEWLHKEESPFFHSIGKYDHDPKGNKTFYDYSVDATVVAKDENNKPFMPVIKSLNYGKVLADKPLGTVVLITDPDHDRLTVTQIESSENIPALKALGVDFTELSQGRILCVYTANQGFLMLMDFWAKQLQNAGKFDNHPRFIIKTTASALSWDEWAANNGVKVVNVPVGFKEIANVLKKAEKQIAENKPVTITDVFNEKIELGVNPRLIFGGEESGGMIIGPEKLIKSKNGRTALAMREKSAAEAIIVASALVASLEKQGKTLSDNLKEVFEENKITGKFDVREDISYYNESESNIEKLKLSKKEGEAKRTKNDLFYLTLALAKFDGLINIGQVRKILQDVFKELDFSALEDIKFTGDGSYLVFADKYVEIRPSGTDAKTKAYASGLSKEELSKYAIALGNYSGERSEIFNSLISDDYYKKAKTYSQNLYQIWSDKKD
ncbi:MAG: hypothetical protein PHX18_00980 [Candidatus Gastranaerophilales bacterium]|nr:hypothetical protein [Candidatus Gastranaerophilales bacterium]